MAKSIEQEVQEFWEEIGKKSIEMQEKFQKLSPEAKKVVVSERERLLDSISAGRIFGNVYK